MSSRAADRAKRLRGSFVMEYAVVLAIVAAALTGMSIYAVRALCGRWREVGDRFGHGRQFEPGVTQCVADGVPQPC